MKRIIVCTFLLQMLTLHANGELNTCLQNTPADTVRKTPEQLGGVYYAYPEPLVAATQAVPHEAGEPFYISHYGRHGSRWLPDDARYEWVLAQFSDTRNLTAQGRSARKRLLKVWKNARGNGGKLTPLGARQHRGIARRMVQRFPEVFTDDTRIWARSSTVDRCRQSMLAFTDQLNRLRPTTPVDVVTDAADMAWLVDNTPEVKALEKRTKRQPLVSPDRFMRALFKDPSQVFGGVSAEQTHALSLRLLSELFTIATDMQDVELRLSLFDLFTPEEMQAVYRANNERMTLCNGTLPESEGIPARAATTLWQNIERDADHVIATGGHGAALRFGHDTNLYRLLSLLQVSTVHHPSRTSEADRFDHMDELLPMAANLQMVFYRKPGLPTTDSTALVSFLHNERPVTLPIPTAHDGLYSWAAVKAYVADRLHRLDHLRQLCALNTMVGTAQANTQTAGLFGKGSEEHGQTLPAVLAPNGQNFWTPQTQDTEKKCVAPYYYKDSLLQGFRNSHWIVGGCTQDYGSFTVATLTGRLRTTPADRATRFSHDDETSHPHYYAVRLPDEHLRVELTGSSHTAMMRVTPEQDGPVHIVVNHNSDEREGTISLADNTVYGYNPVHRIYQGWGEPAGFSGHFLLRFTDELLASGQDSTCVWLTFMGHAQQPIVLQMASSFTDRDGCQRNLEAEALGKSFDQMQAELTDRWIDRLHTIDIEDPDTARVTQFYGALYRASFLPREFSDADGRYVPFANMRSQEVKEPRSQDDTLGDIRQDACLAPSSPCLLDSLRRHFTDFSMWDTYRALHPLLNIIAPSLSAEMMQSLVTMAEQGGWMPIFPCWNSYTAAMIGDHCASVLADAYIKGIGIRPTPLPLPVREGSNYSQTIENQEAELSTPLPHREGLGGESAAGSSVDYPTAYRFLRQNAFDSPTPDEYRNGMGRRALQSYLQHGFVPMEDHVLEAFHTDEQTSRTLEYAYDDFCVAQLAHDFGSQADYRELMRRSENWRNVVNPRTGWADGRHADGTWEQNTDLVNRKSYITEGATCHYTWYVPHNIPALVAAMGGAARFEEKLDSMFRQGLYWHGNEPCHQIAYLYNYIGRSDKTRQWVNHILRTEYNDTPGGLSGNDDAGQMSAWYIFSSLGFYPVCPGTPDYQLGAPTFRRATLNLENGRKFTIEQAAQGPDGPTTPRLNGQPVGGTSISHADILSGGTLHF